MASPSAFTRVCGCALASARARAPPLHQSRASAARAPPPLVSPTPTVASRRDRGAVFVLGGGAKVLLRADVQELVLRLDFNAWYSGRAGDEQRGGAPRGGARQWS